MPLINTTAALTGEAVIAICDATTAILKGALGRIFSLFATSTITGIMENAVCPVPAKIVKKYVTVGAKKLIFLGFLRKICSAARTK